MPVFISPGSARRTDRTRLLRRLFVLMGMMVVLGGVLPAQDLLQPMEVRPLDEKEDEFFKGFDLPMEIQPAPGGDFAELEGELGPGTALERRELLKQLTLAYESLQQQKYDIAFPILQDLLSRPLDLMLSAEDFPQAGGLPERKQFYSVKEIIGHLLFSLPEEGRQFYRLQYGAIAEELLKQAGTDDRKTLALVARSYLLTDAGQGAAYRLANSDFDRAKFLSAAMQYERLLGIKSNAAPVDLLQLKTAWSYYNAGFHEKAELLLSQYAKLNPEAFVTIGGKTFRIGQWYQELFESFIAKRDEPEPLELYTESVGKIDSYVRSRLPAMPIGDPLWVSGLLDDELIAMSETRKELRLKISEMISLSREKGFSLMPVGQPVLVGNLVIYHTLATIEAVDLQSGKLVWRSFQMDDRFQKMILDRQEQSQMIQATGLSNLESVMWSRLWTDLTAPAISSDGERVYGLDRLMLPKSFQQNRLNMRSKIAPVNRLYALDARTGEYLWEVGGYRQENSLELSDTFFMGAPLCHRGRLYVLSVTGSELELLTLSAEEGKPLARQSLINLNSSRIRNPDYLIYNLRPTLCENLLICPTGLGQVLAFDLQRKQLVWDYHFPIKSSPIYETNPFGAVMPPTVDFSDLQANEWADFHPAVGAGRVLLTPPATHRLICLNVVTGEPLWELPQKNKTWLIGIAGQDCFFQGENFIEARQVQDGSLLWRTRVESSLSGRTLLEQSWLHVPLRNGEIVTLEKQTGKVLNRMRVPANLPVGNLIKYEDILLSQSETTLTRFPATTAVLEQMVANQEAEEFDPVVALQQSHYQLLMGHTDEAIEMLRKLDRKYQNQTASQLLVMLLTERVKQKSGISAEEIEEIMALVDGSSDEVPVLRLLVQELIEDQQYVIAVELCLSHWGELEDSEKETAPLYKMEKGLQRLEEWIGYAVAEAYQASLNSDQHARIEGVITQFLEPRLEQGAAGSLRELLVIFRGTSQAVPIRSRLIELLGQETESIALTEREALLVRQLDQATQEEAAMAAGELFQLLMQRSRYRDAERLLVRISETWPDQQVRPQLSGLEFVTEKSALVLERLRAEEVDWGVGEIEVEEMPNRVEFKVPLVLNRRTIHASELSHYQYELDKTVLSHPRLVVKDQYAREKWSIPFTPVSRNLTGPRSNFRAEVLVQGRYLILRLNEELLVFDAHDGKETPVMVLNKSLETPYHQMNPRKYADYRLYGPRSQPAVGPVIDGVIYYRIGTVLYAVDILTNQKKWEKYQVNHEGYLFGSGEMINVLLFRSGEISCHDARTGELVDEMKISNVNRPKEIVEHQYFTIAREDEFRRIRAWRPPEPEPLYQIEFPDSAVHSFCETPDGNYLAVLNRQGVFQVYGLADGKLLSQIEIPPVRNLAMIRMVPYGDTFLVGISAKVVRNPLFTLYQPITGAVNPGFEINTGLLALDKELKQKWYHALKEPTSLVQQPTGYPVCLLACSVSRQQNQAPGVNIFQTKVLDVETGEVIDEQEKVTSRKEINFVHDVERNDLEYRFPTFSLRVAPADGEGIDSESESEVSPVSE